MAAAMAHCPFGQQRYEPFFFGTALAYEVLAKADFLLTSLEVTTPAAVAELKQQLRQFEFHTNLRPRFEKFEGKEKYPGGGVWESNPTDVDSRLRPTVLKTAPITRSDAPPRNARECTTGKKSGKVWGGPRESGQVQESQVFQTLLNFPGHRSTD